MKTALSIVVAFVTMLLTTAASSADLVVDFVWPTQHTDGSPIPVSGPGQLTTARIEYGTCVDPEKDVLGVVEGQLTAIFPATRVTGPVSAGIKCVRGYAMTDLNVESRVSNLGRYFPAPNPVVARTSTKIAYELRRKAGTDNYVFFEVGTVQLNAACGIKLAGTFFKVSGARITKPLTGGVIAAKCN